MFEGTPTVASKHRGAPAFGSSGQTQGPGRSGPPLTSAQDTNSSSRGGVLNWRGTEHEPPLMEGKCKESVPVMLVVMNVPPAPGHSLHLSS
jgi:hypothetical protein